MIKKSVLALFLVIALLTPFSSVYAVDPFRDVCYGEAEQSAACQSRTQENPLLGPSGTLTKVINLIIRFTAVIAVFMLIVGGFRYVISAGDSNSINGAKNTILYAIIGLVVAITGQFIVSFVLSRL